MMRLVAILIVLGIASGVHAQNAAGQSARDSHGSFGCRRERCRSDRDHARWPGENHHDQSDRRL